MERLGRDNQAKATQNVLAHVERAKDSLRNIRADNLSSDGVFMHPQMALVSLLMRAMPGWLYDRIMARAPRKPRDVQI